MNLIYAALILIIVVQMLLLAGITKIINILNGE